MGVGGWKWIVCLGIGVAQVFAETEVTRRVPVDPKLPAYEVAAPLSPQKLSINGSGVMAGIITPLTKQFVAIHKDVDVELSYPSSTVVFDGLMDGTITVGAMSRALTELEKIAFERKYGHRIFEVCIALDALEILVNRFNPVAGITLEQLDGIYSTACLRGGPPVSAWGDLGLSGTWLNLPVEAYGGGPGWGTTRTFESLVCWGAVSKPSVHQKNIEDGILEAVAADVAGIGYTCLGQRSAEVRSVPVAESPAGPFVSCTAQTLQDGTYPLRRPLYLYVVPGGDGEMPAVVRGFLHFALSRDGQKIVSESGMVPLDAKQAALERKRLGK